MDTGITGFSGAAESLKEATGTFGQGCFRGVPLDEVVPTSHLSTVLHPALPEGLA